MKQIGWNWSKILLISKKYYYYYGLIHLEVVSQFHEALPATEKGDAAVHKLTGNYLRETNKRVSRKAKKLAPPQTSSWPHPRTSSWPHPRTSSRAARQTIHRCLLWWISSSMRQKKRGKSGLGQRVTKRMKARRRDIPLLSNVFPMYHLNTQEALPYVLSTSQTKLLEETLKLAFGHKDKKRGAIIPPRVWEGF